MTEKAKEAKSFAEGVVNRIQMKERRIRLDIKIGCSL